MIADTQSEQDQLAVVPARVPWPAVVGFVVIAAALAWVACLPLWLGPGLTDPVRLQLCAMGMMFTPLLATVAALIIQRRNRHTTGPSIPRYLGIWPLKPARRVIWMIVVAFVGTFLLAVGTLVLAGVVGWADLDLSGAGLDSLRSASPSMGSLSNAALAAISLSAIVPNALFTAIFAFGEEVGWRGWLLTTLRPLGTWPALLITGAIWGLWHAPLILLGYNFARPDLGGLALMVGGCVAIGALFGWTRIRTGSVWPAVAAHGMLNAATPTLIMMTTPPGQAPDGAFVAALGFPGWILIAVIVAVLIITGQFRRQPELG
ncbi:CPBP family intramembrane glutamic endopeptidase [Microlunatus soli]|uniref:CAAX protease self-immunity n=1 Tax=Microlunatus soli TaxID=630515 RepID=A0A1H1PUM2_9ACTN|nr:CPBP family intramembrane glutamic endopeptidase [Microlunatus soli]SDS14888.1 CAAX protease self-immunity [Microlunatus soli]